jgi:predicted ABC-type sugar transport system permease subunit
MDEPKMVISTLISNKYDFLFLARGRTLYKPNMLYATYSNEHLIAYLIIIIIIIIIIIKSFFFLKNYPSPSHIPTKYNYPLDEK